jgi:hypothetical protein
MAMTRAGEDEFPIWPTALACCFPALLAIPWTAGFDLGFFDTAVLCAFWVSLSLHALVIAIRSAKTGE